MVEIVLNPLINYYLLKELVKIHRYVIKSQNGAKLTQHQNKNFTEISNSMKCVPIKLIA